mgnify:FL=1
MLQRKITHKIEEYLRSSSNKMLLVDGARQIGKTYIIRHVCSAMFPNYIEINMEEDRQHDRLFANAKTIQSFYFALSSIAGEKMGNRSDTVVFIDEIQAYDHLLTLVKFLMQDGKFTFVASGSLLGVTLKKTQSVPVGSLQQLHMYPLDFEEFLWGNGVGDLAIQEMKRCYESNEALPEAMHKKMMGLFRVYLLVGGLPDAVNSYLADHNIMKVRKIQEDVIDLYFDDAAKYEMESSKKLKIQRIYEMIPSNMENRRKRMVINSIEDKQGARTSTYSEEFEYLVSSGIALEVDAISNPTYPLVQNAGKNLLKLYMNDVGLLTWLLYRNNIMPILDDVKSINLGSVYETVVAQELWAHGFELYYYDNKKNGEVDYLVDDVMTMSSLPIEVKSGKDYMVHSALDKFMKNPDYNVHKAIVVSNEREITVKDGIKYMPIYDIMFLSRDLELDESQMFF